MPLNLDPIKRFVQDQMTDTFRISRDPLGFRDNIFNTYTGEYEPDADPVYEGPGLIVTVSASPTQEPEGGGESRYTRFQAMFPLDDCPELHIHDMIVCLTSLRDPLLPGKEFLIEAPEYSTFQVTRSAQVSRREKTANV